MNFAWIVYDLSALTVTDREPSATAEGKFDTRVMFFPTRTGFFPNRTFEYEANGLWWRSPREERRCFAGTLIPYMRQNTCSRMESHCREPDAMC